MVHAVSQLKSSSAGTIWMCRAFFTSSSCPPAMVSVSSQQAVACVVVLSCSICCIWSTAPSSNWSPLCRTGHSFRNRMHGDIRLFTCGNVSLTLDKDSYIPTLETGEKTEGAPRHLRQGKVSHSGAYVEESPHHALHGRRYQCISALSLPD